MGKKIPVCTPNTPNASSSLGNGFTSVSEIQLKKLISGAYAVVYSCDKKHLTSPQFADTAASVLTEFNRRNRHKRFRFFLHICGMREADFVPLLGDPYYSALAELADVVHLVYFHDIDEAMEAARAHIKKLGEIRRYYAYERLSNVIQFIFSHAGRLAVWLAFAACVYLYVKTLSPNLSWNTRFLGLLETPVLDDLPSGAIALIPFIFAVPITTFLPVFAFKKNKRFDNYYGGTIMHPMLKVSMRAKKQLIGEQPVGTLYNLILSGSALISVYGIIAFAVNEIIPWSVLPAAFLLGFILDALRRISLRQVLLKRISSENHTKKGQPFPRRLLRGSSMVMRTALRIPLCTEKPVGVFISYTHSSQWSQMVVSRLHSNFEKCGIGCFIDKYGISPGSSWRHRLHEKINDATLVICVADQKTIQKPWPAAEFETALRMRRNRSCPEIVLIIPEDLDKEDEARALPVFQEALLSEGYPENFVRVARCENINDTCDALVWRSLMKKERNHPFNHQLAFMRPVYWINFFQSLAIPVGVALLPIAVTIFTLVHMIGASFDWATALHALELFSAKAPFWVIAAASWSVAFILCDLTEGAFKYTTADTPTRSSGFKKILLLLPIAVYVALITAAFGVCPHPAGLIAILAGICAGVFSEKKFRMFRAERFHEFENRVDVFEPEMLRRLSENKSKYWNPSAYHDVGYAKKVPVEGTRVCDTVSEKAAAFGSKERDATAHSTFHKKKENLEMIIKSGGSAKLLSGAALAAADAAAFIGYYKESVELRKEGITYLYASLSRNYTDSTELYMQYYLLAETHVLMLDYEEVNRYIKTALARLRKNYDLHIATLQSTNSKILRIINMDLTLGFKMQVNNIEAECIKGIEAFTKERLG